MFLPLLRWFLGSLSAASGMFEEETPLLNALALVCDCLRLGDAVLLELPDVRSAISAFVRDFVGQLPGEARPKTHYLQHVPDMLASHQSFLACFSAERRHRLIKRTAATCFRWFESTLTRNLITQCSS